MKKDLFNINYIEFEIITKKGKKLKRDFSGANIMILLIYSLSEVLYDLYDAEKVTCTSIKK